MVLKFPQIYRDITLNNREISSYSLFMTVPFLKKKIVPPAASSAVKHKNEGSFSRFLAIRIQTIRVLFIIHVYLDSCTIRIFSIPGSLLMCKWLI